MTSTTRPVSTGAILSFNLLNTNTQAYVSYTNPLPHTTSPDVAAAHGVTVSAQDMATITATIVLGATLSVSGSAGAQAIAGAVSFNQVSGGASASVGNAAVQLTGGALLVTATEAATITANTQSEVAASSSNSSGTSGGSTSGGQSLGASGILGVNVVQGAATAIVTGSTVTATAGSGQNVTVTADNKLTLNATSISSANITTGSTTQAAAALSLAMNALGYNSSKGVLFATLDALLGTTFDTQTDAGALASIGTSTVNASGLVSVNAVNESQITATMSNTTTASNKGTQGAQASSLNATVALNEVSGDAQASIKSSNTTAGNGVSVTAQDNAGISATLTLGSTLTTSGSNTGVGAAVALNDVHGGAAALVNSATLTASGGNILVQAKETATITASMTDELTSGPPSKSNDTSSSNTTGGGTTSSPLAVGGVIGSNVVQSAASATLSNSQVTTTATGAGGVTVDAENTATLTATTKNAGTSSSTNGASAVGVTLAFNTVGWKAENVLFDTIDAIIGDPLLAFGGQNPSNATATILDTTVHASGQLTVSALDDSSITSTVSNTTTASTSSSSGSGSTTGVKGGQNLGLGIVVAMNKVSGSASASIDYDSKFTPPSSGSYVQASGGVSVTATDSSGIGATITLGSSTTASGGANSGSSTNVAGAVSLNDVRGGATATVDSTSGTASMMTTGGSVLVQAKETSTLTATTTSELTATMSSTTGANAGSTSSSPLVVGGLIGTNLVQSAASATLGSSQVTTTGAGGVTVDAENTAKLTAITTNAATASSSSGSGSGGGSGSRAVGVTLAFNTIGWQSQNVLFNTIDALLGSPTLASAFGGENPSNATATMLDTTVNTSGELTVSALDATTITSTIGNTSTASTSGGSGSGSTTGMKGGQNLALGFVLASNKVSSSAQASIDFDTGNLPASTIQAGGGVSVTAQDSSGISATINLGSSSTVSVASNVRLGTLIFHVQAQGGSTGVAGAVSLNDVQGGATASLTHTTLSTTGGNVLVQAKEMATLTATTTSEVSAGSSSTPKTTAGSTTTSPLALDGLIGTNLVQSAASATLGNSHVTTTGGGGVTVDAENTAKLTAMTTNAATASTSTGSGGSGSGGGSGNTAVGVTLAFNTIGWKSENVLFSAIDALLGDSLLAGAFSGENPSNATATMLDTTVNASGKLTVSALDGTTITSTIGNTSTASTSGGGTGGTTGQKGGQNLALGFVLASNKVNGSAQASIDFDTGNLPASTIQAGGGVSVTAQDSSSISATITLGSSSTAAGGGSTGVAGAVSLNDVRGGAAASLTHTTLSTTGGNVLVQAKEMATLTATTLSEVSAGSTSTPTTTAGSTTKSPLALDGLIGTNLVQSSATATLGNSNITTAGTGAGGVTVDAENTAKLTAMTTNAATASTSSGGSGSGSGGGGGSGTTAVGVTLAFNTVGWKSENVLFSAIDALLGDSLIAGAFSGENPSNATAVMLDTAVSASGLLTVSALDKATITSTISNTTTASTTSAVAVSAAAVAPAARRGARTWRWASYWPRTRSPAVPRPASTLTPTTFRPPQSRRVAACR